MRWMVVALFFECLALQPACSDRHELVQNHEFQSNLEGVTEGLDRVAEADLVEVHHDDGGDIQSDDNNVDIYKIEHDPTLAHA